MPDVEKNSPRAKVVLQSPRLGASAEIGSRGEEMSAAGRKDVVNLGKWKVVRVVDAIPRGWMFWKQNCLGGNEAAEKKQDNKTHADSGGDAACRCACFGFSHRIREQRLTTQGQRRRPRGAPMATAMARRRSQPRQGRNLCRREVH